VPIPIGKLVGDALKSSDFTQQGFCRAVSYDQGSLQGVIKGQRKPPRGREEAWADALRLKGDARHEFLLSYWCSDAPEQLAAEVDRLRVERRRR